MPETDGKKLLANFDPNEPASEFYVNTVPARGGGFVATEIYEQLAASSSYRQILFSGHIGSGKSSELLQICKHCREPEGGIGPKFFTYYVDLDPFVDRLNIDIRDVLFGIVATLEHITVQELKKSLQPSYTMKKLDEVRDLLQSLVDPTNLKVKAPFFEVAIDLKKVSRENRDKVRVMLEQAETLASEINLVISKAREIALSAGYDDIVIIVDGLDKFEKLSDSRNDGRDQVIFFIDRAYHLKSLSAHIIWTVPLDLVRSTGKTLGSTYSSEPVVLPLIKIRDREGSPFPLGCQTVEEILKKRFQSEGLVKDTFTTDALRTLIEASGGHPRQLMRLTEMAIRFSFKPGLRVEFPIQETAVLKARGRMWLTTDGILREGDWDLFLDLEKTKKRDWSVDTERKQVLLEQDCVLEYINGDEQKGAPDRWYAINPVIRTSQDWVDRWDAYKAQLSAEPT